MHTSLFRSVKIRGNITVNFFVSYVIMKFQKILKKIEI